MQVAGSMVDFVTLWTSVSLTDGWSGALRLHSSFTGYHLGKALRYYSPDLRFGQSSLQIFDLGDAF